MFWRPQCIVGVLFVFFRSISHFEKTKLYEIGGSIREMVVCAYCGAPATEVEHCTPKSFVAALGDLGFEWKRLMLYPACKDCNRLCGAKVFMRLKDKACFIAKRLGEKYKKVLLIPDWKPLIVGT